MVNPWPPLAGTVFPRSATLTIVSFFSFTESLMLSRLIFLLTCALVPALTPSMASARTILVFGDSLSAAYGLAQHLGWPALLEKRLRDEGYDYRVANASISGETTTGGASRIAGAL